MEHVPDPRKGDRFLLELLLTDSRTAGQNMLLSEHLFRSSMDKKLYYPEGFYWKKEVTVNILVPVKNGGRWALYFIKNIAGAHQPAILGCAGSLALFFLCLILFA